MIYEAYVLHGLIDDRFYIRRFNTNECLYSYVEYHLEKCFEYKFDTNLIFCRVKFERMWHYVLSVTEKIKIAEGNTIEELRLNSAEYLI